MFYYATSIVSPYYSHQILFTPDRRSDAWLCSTYEQAFRGHHKNRDRQDVASIVVCNNQFGNNGHIRHINFTWPKPKWIIRNTHRIADAPNFFPRWRHAKPIIEITTRNQYLPIFGLFFFSFYNTDRFFFYRGITLSMCFNTTNRRLCKVNHRNGHRIISKRVLIIFKILQHNDTLWIPFSRHLKPFL